MDVKDRSYRSWTSPITDSPRDAQDQSDLGKIQNFSKAQAQWIHLCLQPYNPGFESYAHDHCFFQKIIETIFVIAFWKRNEKETSVGPF